MYNCRQNSGELVVFILFNIFAVSFNGPIVMAIMFISPGLDIDYSKMEQVQNVKASVGLIRPSSPSTERPSKRKASSSIRSNSSSRIGASAFTSLHSSQTPGRQFKHDFY